MTEQNGQEQSSRAVWTVPLVVLGVIVTAAVVWRIVYAPPPAMVARAAPEVNQAPLQPAAQQPLIIESKERALQPVIKARITIDDIIKVRKYWQPAFVDWVGRQAPEFELADINGKNHKISSYRGKTLMLIFWATWCGPCRMEIPELIKLRSEVSPEKLAMLAISYEQSETVRRFLSQRPVNYTVIATPPNMMPPPFRFIDAIPTTLFIDKDGVIRLASEGFLLPNELTMILRAIDS
jgi:thiol-disulfide isomerase/thioredoxin